MNAAGNPRQKWYALGGTKFTKPDRSLFAKPSSSLSFSISEDCGDRNNPLSEAKRINFMTALQHRGDQSVVGSAPSIENVGAYEAILYRNGLKTDPQVA